MRIILALTVIILYSFTGDESINSRVVKTSLRLINYNEITLEKVKNEKKFVDERIEKPEPDKNFINRFNIETVEISNKNVYTISPKKHASGSVVFFIHGGAYMANFLGVHWDFIGKLIDKTGVTIITPDYPLAPNGTWQEAFKMLEHVQNNILNNYEDIAFMGDSAGAGLALAWSMELYNRNLPIPRTLILLSPWLDVSMTNPNIDKVELSDPLLSKTALEIAGRYWAGNSSVKSWQVSPIYGNLKSLPHITMFTGTSDILNSDAKLFNKLMIENGNSIDYREFDNMIHDWMFLSMKESKECFNQIVELDFFNNNTAIY